MSFLTEVTGPPVTDVPSPQWMFDQIETWAARSPERLAFVLDHQDRTEEYRYPDLLNQAAAIASDLTARGIQRGDRIGIVMENTPQWVFVLLGALRIGAITVPLATTLPEDSIERIARHAACKLIFADEPNWPKASSVAAKMGITAIGNSKFEVGSWRPGSPTSDLQSRISNMFAVDPASTAILIYTSGTTGNPKGVELTFENLNYEIRGAIEALRLTPDHRILSVLPFSHVLPLIANGLGALCIGATVVFLSSI